MQFLTLEDLHGTFEVTIFPRDYERLGSLIGMSRILRVTGRVSNRAGVFPSLRATSNRWLSDSITVVPPGGPARAGRAGSRKGVLPLKEQERPVQGGRR